MKTLVTKELNLKEISEEMLYETEGGFVGWNWGVFWRGVSIGVAGGAAGAAIAIV